MTSLSFIGKIAVAIHCKRNPGHVSASNHDILSITHYYCQTCGYPLMSPEEWARSTGQPLEKPKD